jgi:toxin ParE1/3/4
VRVTWSPRARRELDAHQRYIAREQQAAAARIAARIVVATDRLAEHPLYGRAAAWDVRRRLRELPVAGTRYVVLYAIDTTADEVVIVRVVRGAQLRDTD